VKKNRKPTAKPTLQQTLVDADEQNRFTAALAPNDNAQDQLDREHAPGARAPPSVRLLSKPEVCSLVGASFPTIWSWMRQGRFPRARVAGRGNNSKSVWLSTEIDDWLRRLPVRPLKGDADALSPEPV
jgi:predicted DNA-binding transcriptional regulator AlpA